MEPGIYTWIDVLIPVDEEAATDYTVWQFTSGVAWGQRVVPVEEALERLGEVDRMAKCQVLTLHIAQLCGTRIAVYNEG